jgi:hypothetical protein
MDCGIERVVCAVLDFVCWRQREEGETDVLCKNKEE